MTVAALKSDMIVEQVVDDCPGYVTGDRADDGIDNDHLHTDSQNNKVHPGGNSTDD